jgi:response regulator RpfG family c-di-GMP phosphodiesterase
MTGVVASENAELEKAENMDEKNRGVKGMSHDETRDMIVSLRGTHFDPLLVDAFLRQEGEFRRTALELDD